MDPTLRHELPTILNEITTWVRSAQTVMTDRERVSSEGLDARSRLMGAVRAVPSDGDNWRVLALGNADLEPLRRVARLNHLRGLTAHESMLLTRLTGDVATSLGSAGRARGIRRMFSGSRSKQSADQAAEFLQAFWAWGNAANLTAQLTSMHPPAPAEPVSVAEALGDGSSLARLLGEPTQGHGVIPMTMLSDLPAIFSRLEGFKDRHDAAITSVRAAALSVRQAETRRLMAAMPVERLREATRERIVVAPLKAAGLVTVWDALQWRPHNQPVTGMGEISSTRIKGAAQTIWASTLEEVPARIDVSQRTAETGRLLEWLQEWRGIRRAAGFLTAGSLLHDLSFIRELTPAKCSHLLLMPSRMQVSQFSEAVSALRETAARVDGALSPGVRRDVWEDFLADPAGYFSMLEELGLHPKDETKAQGDLSPALVEAIRSCELRTDNLKASLRGYQAFGARFALVQKKVLIGDEMGLGKTIEALAVLSHLRSTGETHFLVISPAAVVTNWMREIASKSELRSHRLHGIGRESAARLWMRDGGVAVTTYDSLRWLRDAHGSRVAVACVVVDEAHYIKNPHAKRTQRTVELLDRSPRAILLTGTPLENRVEEFQALVRHLQPELVVDAGEFSAARFRRQVAPAYLRRNQEDVLVELPELVEVDEWLPMSPADLSEYRQAAIDGNFMRLRQACLIRGEESEKVKRLREIVAEAEDNGRRIIVFSHFREVLHTVARVLPGRVFGPLTGSVPAHERQSLVDAFSSAPGGAVLVCQIVAGGVGLNIQAASVVIICEPQLKPTTEWQAIARARRMGQLHPVQVHRLLNEQGVDLRITEILAKKRELFEQFARDSETARSASEALDISEAELAREVIAAERERLFSQPHEPTSP